MYLTLSSPFGVENNVHEYLTKRTGLFAYWHTNGYTIICCLLMVTYVHLWQRSRCPQQPKIYCSEASGTILAMFRHIQNILKFANDWILSDIQTGGLHLVYRLRIPANLTWHAWDFYLVMTGICGNIPVTSEDFLKTSKHCRKCPQMFWRRLSTSETALQDNNNLSCFHFVRTQKRIHHLTPFWIEFSLGEDKTWTRGPWTPTLDRVHGLLSWTGSMDPLSWTGSMDTFS